jgi:hypothetical protein
MAKARVFVDTNVIIESFRTGCWSAICEHYAIETVEKCIEEAMTGDPADPRYISVDPDTLDAGLGARHSVPKLDIATLALNVPESQGLDDGELHLLALLHRLGVSEDAGIMVSTADKAAIVVAGLLGWLDFLIPLESLAEKSGVTRAQIDRLPSHHRARWLDEVKVKIRLGVIP